VHGLSESTVGSEIFWMHPIELIGAWVTRLKWKLDSVCLDIVSVSVQDRCMVCAKHTIGLEIVLDALDGTPR
jgi:hypothetical protein